MAHRIIRQPNGKLCIYSTVVDNIIHYNLIKEDIVDIWTASARKGYEDQVNDIVDKLDKGENPYRFNHNKDFNETISLIEIVHGKEEKDKIINSIESNERSTN